MRFSLKWLLIAVAFIAVSLVALLNANDLWRIGFRAVVILSVLVAIIGAICLVGSKRVFCGGFTTVALLCFGIQWHTTNVLKALHGKIFTPATQTFAFGEWWFVDNRDDPTKVGTSEIAFPAVNGDVVRVSDRPKPHSDLIIEVVRPTKYHFVAVGHAVLSVVLGVVGGSVAVAFYRRRPKTISA